MPRESLKSRGVTSLCMLIMVSLALPAVAMAAPGKSTVAEGERLVQALDCNICHSPKVFTAEGPQPDPERLLSGHPADSKLPPVPKGVVSPDGWGGLFNGHFTAWAGPWGVSFAANLTPDEETGIGVWTEDLFVGAIRHGKHMGVGRALLPPMPWQAYSNLTDEELHSIFTYLQSLEPVHNKVPEPIPPAPMAK